MAKEEIIRNLKYTMEKHKNDTVGTFGTNISVMCKDILDYLEQEPKWIPVSERLPEENGEYLITWTGILGEHGEKRTKPLLGIAEYEIYEPENYEDWITTGNEFEHYRDIKVSAWMPLPEPYMEVEE